MGDAPRGRIRGFVAGRTTKQKVGGVAGALLVVTAPFGGWKAVPEPAAGTVTIGHHFDVGPYDVSIEKVVWTTNLDPVIKADDGKRLLVVVATMKNTTAEPQYEHLLTNALWTQGSGVDEEGGKPQHPRLFVVADGSDLSQVNPGVGYRVALVFQQDADYADDTIRLDVGRTRFRTAEDDVLTLEPNVWENLAGVARRGTLTIKGKV